MIKDTVVTKESPEERMTDTAFIKHAGRTGSTGRGEQVPKPVTGDSGGDDGLRQTVAVMTEISRDVQGVQERRLKLKVTAKLR